MYKIFKFLFHGLFIKVNKFSMKMIQYFERKDNVVADKKWDVLFGNNDKILFDIDTNLKINLYKDSILSRFIQRGGFEEDEIKYVLKSLIVGDTFIDIGANIGLFSLLASKKIGDKGKVICFEPAPETYRRLNENIELNHIKNIESRNVGLSDKDDELKFYISDTGFDAWNSFAPTNDYKLRKSIDIKVSTLDKELENLDKSTIKLIKIDVEGWEKFVLQGGKSFFENYSPIVMVEFTEENTFNAGYCTHEIFYEMEKLGYEWFRIENGELVKEIKKMHYPYINLIAKKKLN